MLFFPHAKHLSPRYAGDDYYFIINRAKLEDRGEYVIRAENHYGSREEVVFLNVQREYRNESKIIDQARDKSRI